MTKHPASLREALHDLAESASISVPGIQHAGVWVLDGQGQLRTRAASSDLVWMFDSLSLCEGGGKPPGPRPDLDLVGRDSSRGLALVAVQRTGQRSGAGS